MYHKAFNSWILKDFFKELNTFQELSNNVNKKKPTKKV